jgi:hypothetical protein
MKKFNSFENEFFLNLTRENLIEKHKYLQMDQIELEHFNLKPTQLQSAKIIYFKDSNGQIKEFKNSLK